MRTLLILAACVTLALAGTAQANMITHNGSTVFHDTFDGQPVGVNWLNPIAPTANISPGPGEWGVLLSGEYLGIKIETIENPTGPGAYQGARYLHMERPGDGGAAVSRNMGTAYDDGQVHVEMMVYQFVNPGNNYGSVHFNAGNNDGENTGGGGALFQAVSYPSNKIWMMDVDGDWVNGHNLQIAGGGGDLLYATEQWQKWEFDIDLDLNQFVITLDGVQSTTESFVADVPLQYFNTRLNGGGNGTNGSLAYFDSVTGPGPGDANFDGTVDDADAAILAANWQTQGGASWAMGDFNYDGNVDDIDATIMAVNWGTVATAVPEPGTIALLLSVIGWLSLAFYRQKR